MPRVKTPKAMKPRKPKTAVELLPSGTLIARVEIPHRAVPWKVPFVTRSGRSIKDASLVTWQATVAMYARAVMAGRQPYEGPVRLGFRFELRRRPGTVPDLCNLMKSTEDSIQEIIIANDRQVLGYVDPAREIGERDFTTVEAYSA